MKIDTHARTEEQRTLRALGHPLRQKILRELAEGVSSPSDIAKSLDEALPNVSYHVRILLECDAIELVRTAPVRGVFEHFYRATIRPQLSDEAWAALPKSARDELFAQTIETIGKHLSGSAAEGLLEETGTRITRTPLELDEEAYEELVGLLNALLDRAMEFQAEAAARQIKDPRSDPPRRTELAVLHFHRPEAQS